MLCFPRTAFALLQVDVYRRRLRERERRKCLLKDYGVIQSSTTAGSKKLQMIRAKHSKDERSVSLFSGVSLHLFACLCIRQHEMTSNYKGYFIIISEFSFTFANWLDLFSEAETGSTLNPNQIQLIEYLHCVPQCFSVHWLWCDRKQDERRSAWKYKHFLVYVFLFSCSDTRDKMRAFSRFHRFTDHEQIQMAIQSTSVVLFDGIWFLLTAVQTLCCFFFFLYACK